MDNGRRPLFVIDFPLSIFNCLMAIRVGIVGVSGYGGGEALRLCAAHPEFQITYVAGESSAGQKIGERFFGLDPDVSNLTIEKWDPAAAGKVDLLLASLPTGQSAEALAAIPTSTRIVDIGGDHRFKEGWTYGLADVWPEQIRGASRVANPGCYSAASLAAMAPLVKAGIVRNGGIIIDAKSGVSGAGRGGAGPGYGFAETNEDVSAYALFKHAQVPEMLATLNQLGDRKAPATIVFTPNLIPMTRGILAVCYLPLAAGGRRDCLAVAREFYRDRPFVRVVDVPPHTKWATGSNFVFVSYAVDEKSGLVIALAALDNLMKGAAGQAVQNANLMFGLDERAGLAAAPLWP